jgi:HD-like signal output (HDOD) protein
MLDVKQIELRLSRATTLPIMPGIVSQVLSMTDNPDYGARHYEQVISKDAALAAKILRTANSPIFGGNGNITSLQRALSQLGLNTLRSVCMTVAFQSALHNKSLSKRFDPVYFWQHSLAVACASKVLACLKRHPQPEEAFLAGLLHDIGKLALCLFLSEEANTVFNFMQLRKVSQFEAERSCLGITHQEIGRMAAECWSLPEIYHDPIAKHHTPTEDIYEINALTAFVHVGNLLAHEIDKGVSPPNAPEEVDSLILGYLDIPEAQFHPVRQAVAHEVSRISELQSLA